MLYEFGADFLSESDHPLWRLELVLKTRSPLEYNEIGLSSERRRG